MSAEPQPAAAAEVAAVSSRERISNVVTSSWSLFVVSLILLVLTWYLLIWVFDLQPFVLPPPHVVLDSLVDHRSTLLDHAWFTLAEILTGFALAVAVGFPLGLVIAFSRIMDRLLYPPLIISQAVPKIALAPIFLAWFGFGFRTNVAIAFLLAVFPVIINTALGLKALDPDMVRLGRAMGSNAWRMFVKIRLPAAMPSVFAGLKIAITFAVIGAVVGEFVAGSAGLGYAIQVATGLFNMSLAFAAIVVISILGVALFFGVELLERVVLRSHPSVKRAAA